jgi:glycosyltransferase involved in cell wall biosynthesis
MGCRISANVITLNEERNLESCLRSLDWADEIVVVDGGSRDRTVPIARAYADRVVLHPFDDYASQRNRAAVASRGDWIFSIDADERVPAALAREVICAAGAAPPGCAGFWVPIRSRIFGRWFRYSGTRGERKMRLFRRGRGTWCGRVHETVRLTGWAATLARAIEHRSTPDLTTYLKKLERYTSFEAERLAATGRPPARWRSWAMPAWTFVRLYVARLGLLDGPEGFRFCALSALESWVVYQRWSELLR